MRTWDMTEFCQETDGHASTHAIVKVNETQTLLGTEPTGTGAGSPMEREVDSRRISSAKAVDG